MVVFAEGSSSVRRAALHALFGLADMAFWTGSSNWSESSHGDAWTATPALELFYNRKRTNFVFC